jgi:hypothetical protein
MTQREPAGPVALSKVGLRLFNVSALGQRRQVRQKSAERGDQAIGTDMRRSRGLAACIRVDCDRP